MDPGPCLGLPNGREALRKMRVAFSKRRRCPQRAALTAKHRQALGEASRAGSVANQKTRFWKRGQGRQDLPEIAMGRVHVRKRLKAQPSPSGVVGTDKQALAVQKQGSSRFLRCGISRQAARKQQGPEWPCPQASLAAVQEVIEKPHMVLLVEPRETTGGKGFGGSTRSDQSHRIGRAARASGKQTGAVGPQLDDRRTPGLKIAFDNDQLGLGKQTPLGGQIQVARLEEKASLSVDGQTRPKPRSIDRDPGTPGGLRLHGGSMAHEPHAMFRSKQLDEAGGKQRIGMRRSHHDFQGVILPSPIGRGARNGVHAGSPLSQIFATSATACEAMPSPRPGNPSFSVVVPWIPT